MKAPFWALSSTMVFVEFTDGQKAKLALVEKSKGFLERTCSDVRKAIQAEIGELFPPTFHFVVWGSPLSLVQELINVLGKCAVQVSVPVVENHSDGYPENIFCIWNILLLVQSTFDIRVDATVG